METVWYVILSAAFLIYVLLDGFDLGNGILYLFTKDGRFRSACMSSIMGVWHANQTWLVIFGASLFGAFPMAYGVVLSAVYVPVGLLLVGLVLRGVGLEYHETAKRKDLAGLAFGVGSLLAAAAQGLGVGAWLMGLPVEDGRFAGGVWHFLGPFSVLVAAGLPVFYALLGASRLIGKTEGEVQALSFKAAKTTAYLALPVAAVVVVWSLIAAPVWTAKWFSWPGFLVTFLPLVLGALTFLPLISSLAKRNERTPFLYTAALVALLGVGIEASVYPNIVPPAVTVVQAAAQPLALKTMLVGVLIFVPLIALYSVYMFRVFRGKVSEEGYGDEPGTGGDS